MTIYDIPIHTWTAKRVVAPYEGKTVLVVNVASKCGLTPQYEDSSSCKRPTSRAASAWSVSLQSVRRTRARHRREIQTFCSTTYGVTFPLFEKIDVNGEDQSPIYAS